VAGRAAAPALRGADLAAAERLAADFAADLAAGFAADFAGDFAAGRGLFALRGAGFGPAFGGPSADALSRPRAADPHIIFNDLPPQNY
jgi:hypothetical protein